MISYDDVFRHLMAGAASGLGMHMIFHVVFWLSGQAKHWAKDWWGPVQRY